MAPKRSAPPPPPVESSMETDSGSDDDSEEEIAYSPDKNKAPPSQKVPSPESSDDEEEEDEEESEEEEPIAHRPAATNPPPPPPTNPAESDSDEEEDDEEEEEGEPIAPRPAATNPPPPPPPNREESESDEEADDEEEEDEEEGDEEEEEERTAPPPAKTNPPPPPPPNPAESESDDDDDDEGEDEAPPAGHVPEAVANRRVSPPPQVEEKKPVVFFQRAWSKEDEVRILEAMAAHRREHGSVPKPEALEAALAGKLDNTTYGRKELMGKVTSLKSVYSSVRRGRKKLKKEHDHLIFGLCKQVWGSGDAELAGGLVPSDFGEMCKMYPFLGDELKAADRERPGLHKRQFSKISNDAAQDLNLKIKKLRKQEMQNQLSSLDLDREIIKLLMSLIQ